MITVAWWRHRDCRHCQALKAGQCVVEEDHLAELWKLTEQQTRPSSPRRWEIALSQSVQQRPLTMFDDVAA